MALPGENKNSNKVSLDREKDLRVNFRTQIFLTETRLRT